MPAAVLPFLRGRDVTVFTLTPLTVSAAGAITPGSATSLVGRWEQLSLNLQARLEEISAADATRENPMIIKDSADISITEILDRSRVGLQAPLQAGNDYFLLNCTRGGNSWAIYCLRNGYREDLQDGKNVGVGSYKTFDPTVANPALT